MSDPTLYRIDKNEWDVYTASWYEDLFDELVAVGALVPVELLTADGQATIMYACQHSDAGRLTRPEEVKLVSLVRTLIEKIGGSDEVA